MLEVANFSLVMRFPHIDARRRSSTFWFKQNCIDFSSSPARAAFAVAIKYCGDVGWKRLL